MQLCGIREQLILFIIVIIMIVFYFLFKKLTVRSGIYVWREILIPLCNNELIHIL